MLISGLTFHLHCKNIKQDTVQSVTVSLILLRVKFKLFSTSATLFFKNRHVYCLIPVQLWYL